MPTRPPADSDEPTGGASASAENDSQSGSSPDSSPPRSRHFIARHKVLTAATVVLLLLVGTAGGYLYWANEQIADIPRVEAGITPEPEKDHNEKSHPLNILLLGADHGNVGQSVAEDLADGDWTRGAHLSDTVIVVHIPADRQSAQLISIPRDSWVKIQGYPYGNGFGKINAAFSYGGPSLAVDTVEGLTDMAIDHVAIIDWVGFRDLTEAVGGVEVYIPKAFTDYSQNVDWPKGFVTLEGERALQYVRTRHGLPGPVKDDFGRIARQQNFMRELMGKMLSSSTTRNPIQFGKVLSTVTRYLTVDKTWDNDEIRELAWSMRNVQSSDIDFVTAPFGRYATSSDGQSIVRLDRQQLQQLVTAVENNKFQRYIAKHPDERLAGSKSVN